MKRVLLVVFALAGAACTAAQSIMLSVESTENGQTITPGTVVHWTVRFAVSSGNSAGAALVSTDLVQDAANPATLDIPAASGPIPAGMTNFARPAGITNPGDDLIANGYFGVSRGPVGAKNLLQIGGAQNTFGIAQPGGTGIAESAAVVSGVGQGSAQVLASGAFAAPATGGVYVFRIDHAFGSVLTQVHAPPSISPTAVAAVLYAGQSFSFTVLAPTVLYGDMNCDGAVNNFDIDPFVLALVDPTSYGSTYPACDPLHGDVNRDTLFNNFDIDAFVDCVLNLPSSGEPCP